MMACSNDLIYPLLDILHHDYSTKKLDDQLLLDNIFSTLEKLSRLSINTQEIRRICQLFHQNTPFSKRLLRVLIIAAKHDNPDIQMISSYFDLQRSNSGIILPIINHWPSISSSSLHFSFHCWLRLNHDRDNHSSDFRRQIYSFYSNSIGLESFICNSSIYILVSDRHELAYIELNECENLIDGCWHSLTIVHTAQRPSLLLAAFRTVSTCHLTVYIDGLFRKQVKDFKYVPLMNDPIHFASIGAPSQRPQLSTIALKNDSLYFLTTIAKTIRPLKDLFLSKNKNLVSWPENQVRDSRNKEIREPNSQDALFGQSTCLHGQLACVWVLAETLNETQVKHLHAMGADFCHRNPTYDDDASVSSTIFDLLSTHSVVLYHPLACHGQICVDVSTCTSQMNGQLINGSCLRLYSLAESLHNLGGCPVLYPLIELFKEADYIDSLPTDNLSSVTTLESSSTDSIAICKQPQMYLSDVDDRVISNPIASILNLIRHVLSSTSMTVLIEQMTKHYNIELLAQYLHRIPAIFIDQQLLLAVQQLLECRRLNEISVILISQFIQYILLDFTLWNKGKFPVRIAHLQYIILAMQDEKTFYRTKFGVQFFLDAIRQHFNSAEGDADEQKQLRNAVYGIIKYCVQSHMRIEELNALLSAIATFSTSSDAITQELLDFILALLDSLSPSTETIIGLLCEPNMTENLYALLTVNNLSEKTKVIVLKIIKNLVISPRVSQQIRAQLRLETNNIGFGGIISGLAANELNVSIIREIINIITTSDSLVAIDHLNVVITLCAVASLDVRHVVVRKIMTCFITHPAICRSYSKCHGWQETLAHLFVKCRRSTSMQSFCRSTSSAISIDAFPTYVKNLSVDSGREMSIHTKHDTSSVQIPLILPRVFETSSSPDDPAQERIVRQIDLSPIINESAHMHLTRTFSSSYESVTSNSLLTPISVSIRSRDSTPEFLRRNSEEFHQSTIETISIVLQSPATKREDLLSIDKTEDSNNALDLMTTSNDLLSSLSPNITSGTTSTDDTLFLLSSPACTDDSTVLEEFCETLLLTIVMVLWEGVTGCDAEAWMIRGQIFSALHSLHREYEFFLPMVYIERRILELSMETCLNDLKFNGGKTTPTYVSNCRELIKLVDDFLSQTSETHQRLTDHFVRGIMSILDTTIICKESNIGSDQTISTLVSYDQHWTEISLTVLNILLTVLAHSNISYCAQASVRIHSLLQSRPLNGREEAAYLLSNINHIFSTISQYEDSEHLGYVLPIMKIIIEQSYDILQMNVQIPNVPLHKATLTALDDFRQYSSSSNSQEWQMFIQKHIEPLSEQYCSISIRPLRMNMKLWWNNCHEMMTIGIQKRNRQIEGEKSKFQNHIVDQWRLRRRSDHQRILKLAKQRRIHRIHVEHEWKDRKKYLFSECGPWWNDESCRGRHWMLSDRENIHRMRCKLVENDHFNRHDEASRSRDNLAIDTTHESDQFLFEESLKNPNLLFQQEILYGTTDDEQERLAATNETQLLLLEEKEKIIIGTHCLLITSTATTDGKLEITNKYIYFFDSTPQNSCQNDFKYPLSWLQDVHLRRYNLRPSALEFVLLDQKSFLINFDKKLRREIYQKVMSLKLPGMKSVFSALSTNITPQEILKASKLTEKWIAQEISNFDYLMILNTIAGRTYNDLNQYPVFPWILQDYTSDVLDLNNPNVFRDLSKPMGVQNPKHIEQVQFKYESFEDPTGLMKRFHYGTHYSNAAIVMHYLIRMEPFTTLHIQLQSGKFDIADRQFHSFQSAWSNIMNSPNDVKELIPEFFYLSEFLTNSNKFDLGKLQISNQIVNDVQLPPWAHDSAEEFIRLHRLALESDYVSSHLHEWIDLIFGYKQTGQAAIDALNVFMYCSYEKAVDVDAIEDLVTREAVEGMIQNFGQIPSQLFTEPHPQRQTREQVIFDRKLQGHALNIFQHLTHIRAFFVEVTPANDKLCEPITFISIPKNQIRSFMQQGIPNTLVTVSINGVVGNNGWQPYDKSLSSLFTFERDPTLQIESNRRIIAAPFSPSIQITSRLFAVSHDAKFVFSGGHWDCSLRVYSLFQSKTISSIIHHTDVITCLILDSTGYILVSGSRDTTCVIWNLSYGDNRNLSHITDQESTSLLSPTLTLYGHTSEVTCVCVSTELDLVVSGSLDGTCNIHTVEHGIYMRTLRPIGDPIINLQFSNERHLLIQTAKENTHLFLYTINGELVRTKTLDYRVVDILLNDEHIVLAVNHMPSSKISNKKSTGSIAAIIFIENMFEMNIIQTIRLQTEINCLYFAEHSTHLLVGTKDGKMIVIAAQA